MWAALGSVVVMEVMGGGEGDDPEADDDGANGENPAAGRPVVGSESGGFASAKDLTADADGHEDDAEDEGNPDHSFTFLP